MNAIPSSSTLRASLIAAALFLAPSLVNARSAASDDAPARKLARTGMLALNHVGPYVEAGTYRVQVAVKLGQPSSVLPDGTWLYNGFNIVDSDATGTLVIRFSNGRVTGLSLGTPQTIAALRTAPAKPTSTFFAGNDPRR